jgi:hypothetical protein
MQRYTIRLFLQNPLHVSGGSSAHHQELKTAHTASRVYFQCNQKDATLHNSFISAKRCTCFRRFLRPSSGAQKLYIQHLVFVKPLLLHFAVVEELELMSSNSSTTAKGSSNGLTNTRCCMYRFWAPDDGRRNCLKHAEHFAEINELCKVASSWLKLEMKEIFFLSNMADSIYNNISTN